MVGRMNSKEKEIPLLLCCLEIHGLHGELPCGKVLDAAGLIGYREGIVPISE